MPPFQMASIEKNFALRQGFATGYSISDNGFTYLLHINPDAIFQDGTPITAQSIKEAWGYAAWPENQVDWGAILLHTRAIEGMSAIESGNALTTSGLRAIDDFTLEITMVKFMPTWPLHMAVWMLGAFKADQAINDPEGFRLNPIGAGPYRATYFDDTAKQEYTATSNWWGAAPVIKKIHRPPLLTCRPVTSCTRTASLMCSTPTLSSSQQYGSRPTRTMEIWFPTAARACGTPRT